MLLGLIGNSVVLVTVLVWAIYLASSAKKLSDVSWPGSLLIGAIFGVMLGLSIALITDTLPSSGGSGNTWDGEPVYRDR